MPAMPTPARSGPRSIPKTPTTKSAPTVHTSEETTARLTAVSVDVRLARRGSTTVSDDGVSTPIFDNADTANCSRLVNLTINLVTRRRSHLLTSAVMPRITSARIGFITNQSAARATRRLCVRFHAASQKNDGVWPHASVNATSSSDWNGHPPGTIRRICES